MSTAVSAAAIDDVLRPLSEAVAAVPASKHSDAHAKLSALKDEVAKGKNADDGAVAKLIDGLVGLVPEVASAVVSAFASPILGEIVGPVTGFVLNKLKRE